MQWAERHDKGGTRIFRIYAAKMVVNMIEYCLIGSRLFAESAINLQRHPRLRKYKTGYPHLPPECPSLSPAASSFRLGRPPFSPFTRAALFFAALLTDPPLHPISAIHFLLP